jgi:hypothetical protein
VLTSCLVALCLAPSFSAARVRPDFNRDGRADLAVGTPFEDVTRRADGALSVLYGGHHHLTTRGSQLLSEASRGMAGDGPKRGDFLGWKLASGDFNGDGRDDLAAGTPNRIETGGVLVLYGGHHHLTTRHSQFLTEDTPGMAGGGADPQGRFGLTLAASDFNGDGRDDLAVGAPDENLARPSFYADGVVHVLYGGRGGLRPGTDQLLTERMRGIHHGRDSRFGLGLAAGDFNGDRRDDLAIGAPNEEVRDVGSAGAVHVLHGGRQGLTLKHYQFLTEETPGVAGGGSGPTDDFGRVLAAGDFNGDRRDDLAIAAPHKGVHGHFAGAVNVLSGGARQLRLRGDQYLTEDTPGLAGDGAEEDDCFGCSLAAGDFNGDRRDELAVGAPRNTATVFADGAVHVVYGGSRHLTLQGNQFLTQDTAGMKGDGAAVDDWFGFSLGAGDFDGDGRDDLAIGEPQQPEDCTGASGGGIHVLYGARRHLALLGNQFLTQDSSGMAGDGSEPCDGFGFSLASRAP